MTENEEMGPKKVKNSQKKTAIFFFFFSWFFDFFFKDFKNVFKFFGNFLNQNVWWYNLRIVYGLEIIKNLRMN